MAFAESHFAQFISSGTGRAIRIIAGIALIVWGLAHRESTAGVAVMIVGLVPLAAGLFDLCLLSPLLGGPISGSAIRSCRPPGAR